MPLSHIHEAAMWRRRGDGRVTTDLTPGDDAAFGVGVQTDGKIVAAGHAARRGGRFALSRYLGG